MPFLLSSGISAGNTKICTRKSYWETKLLNHCQKTQRWVNDLHDIDSNFPPRHVIIACFICHKIINLQALESKLDVLNITICRRQAAYEVCVDFSNFCLVLSFLLQFELLVFLSTAGELKGFHLESLCIQLVSLYEA